jgi:hypothetical protein
MVVTILVIRSVLRRTLYVGKSGGVVVGDIAGEE